MSRLCDGVVKIFVLVYRGGGLQVCILFVKNSWWCAEENFVHHHHAYGVCLKSFNESFLLFLSVKFKG